MANIDLIKKAVDTTILLINSDCQWDWVASIVGDLLQLVTELRCVLGSCGVLRRFQRHKITVLRHVSLTFQILRSEQQTPNVMLFNKRLDVWSHRRPIEAHHEQLALYNTPLANPVAAV